MPFDLPMHLKKSNFHKYLRNEVYIAMRLYYKNVIRTTWKQPNCCLMNDWTGNMWCIHLMESYSVSKRKEIPKYVTT